MKNLFKDYFSFSRKERIGIIILLLLIGAFIVGPEFYEPQLPSIQVDTLSFRTLPEPEKLVALVAEKKESKLFIFDPNTISETQWGELGLSPKIIQTILNYRSKGGLFRTAIDIKKIWGILPEEADRLIPYIHIDNAIISSKSRFNKPSYSYTPKTIIAIDINAATAAEWESLPGIGTVLAARIIKYRDKLGGFTQPSQVQKTYGISDTLFQQLIPYLRFSAVPEKPSGGLININTASLAQLTSVGVPEEVAKAIVLYRKQYGPYLALDDLKKIVFINEGIYQQIFGKLTIQ